MPHPMPRASDWEGWVWPVPVIDGRPPVISDNFKPVKTEEHRFHPGVDIMFRKEKGDPGFPFSSTNYTSLGDQTPIIAAGPGTIWDAGPGRKLQISIDHGRHLGGTVTWYQHLASFSRAWKRGDKIRAGDVLGTMGGDSKKGEYPLVHLHFELWFPRTGKARNTWRADPARYMRFWKKIGLASTVA